MGSSSSSDSAEKTSVHPSRTSEPALRLSKGRTEETLKSLWIFPFMLSLSKHSWGFQQINSYAGNSLNQKTVKNSIGALRQSSGRTVKKLDFTNCTIRSAEPDEADEA
jgi:hypothetical protein